MKKLICVLLALSLMVMCTGCIEPANKENKNSNESNEQAQVEVNADNMCGTWQAELDLSEFLTSEMGQYEALQTGLLVSDFYVTVTMEFREDGTYKIWLDKQTLNASFGVLMEAVDELLWQDLEMMYMDPESELTLEEALAKDGVDPKKDLEEIRKHQSSEGYVSKLQERIDREGNYQLIEDELYLSASLDEETNNQVCDIVEMTADTLTFVENYGELLSEGYLLYPLTFQRVK